MVRRWRRGVIVQKWCSGAEVVQTDCTEVAQRCRWRCRCSWTEGVDVNAGVGSDTVKGSRNSGILEY